jgi:phenylalanyl-tRNA synthetase alpha subunit
MFHQVEGLIVDKDANFAQLKGLLIDFLILFFKKSTQWNNLHQAHTESKHWKVK